MILSIKILILFLLFSLQQNIFSEETNISNFKAEIGTWQEAPYLVEPVLGHYSFTVLDKITVFVGQGMSSSKAITFTGEINKQGIKYWKKGVSLAYTVEAFGAIMKDGFLYIVGGKNMGMEKGSVIFFPINPDGTLGKGASAPMLPESLSKMAVIVSNGYIFASGGKQNKTISNRVFSSLLDKNGMPGNWQELAPLPTGVYDHIMFTYKDFIYIFGGYHNAGSVYGAKINSNGTIDKWIGLDDAPISMERHAGVVYKDHIFISGGMSDGRSNSHVYAGEFLEGGLVIKWKKLQDLPQPIFDHSMTINENFIIVSGGMSGGRAQSKVIIAPLF
ncbi:hypothetical protein HZA55_01625 [Candidatus Poribacteria bacterium]|nr:hypothetical protein [Candidatus Poribacteria bacterium]